MPQFQIKHITPFSSCHPKQGIYLWIIHATKIPPHVGISIDGNYFSLKINGLDDLNVEQVLKIIQKKQIATLLVKLEGNAVDFKRFVTVRNAYHLIIAGETTCLTPINSLLLENTKNVLLPELLEILSVEKKIENVFGLNLPENFTGHIAYDEAQVNKRLNELKNAKRRIHIS